MGRGCQETAASSKALVPISRLTFMWPRGASEMRLNQTEWTADVFVVVRSRGGRKAGPRVAEGQEL